MMAYTQRRYVNVRLIVEEGGVLDDSGPCPTKVFTLYDPNGILDGELEMVCTDQQLDGELAKLSPGLSSDPRFGQVNPYNRTTGQYSQATPSYQPRVVGASKKLQIAHLEAPPGVTAGGLVDSLATQTGTQSAFTQLLADLVDDILRPQK